MVEAINTNPLKTIEISSALQEKKEVSLYNTLGQKILNENFSTQNHSVNISTFATRIYFVEVKGEKGAMRKKVMKM